MASAPFDALTPLQLLTVCLWGEGRGEPREGRIAIGHVILNRANARHQAINDVILAPSQFSCFSPKGGGENFTAVRKLAQELVQNPYAHQHDLLWKETQWIAVGVQQRSLVDEIGGADHYVTTALYNSPECPAWAKKMRITCTIGRHTFLR